MAVWFGGRAEISSPTLFCSLLLELPNILLSLYCIGPRKRVKTENEEESKVIAEAFEALHDDTIQESEQTASLQDGDTITEANIAEAAATGALPEDNLEGFVPLSFGKKQTAEDYLLMGLAETRKKKPVLTHYLANAFAGD